MKKSKSIPATIMMVGASLMQGALGNVQAQPSGERESKEAIRPFRVNFPEKDLMDLKRRILETRWPEKETVSDQTQGVQLATMKALTNYWATEYDWRKVEARL